MPIPIKPETLKFLSNLADHNNREWFNANKGIYLSARDNFSLFVQTLLDEMSKFDRSVAGLEANSTIFRIYRDIRFSRDKTPYQTHFSASLGGKGNASKLAGYYLFVKPSASFLAGGVHMSEPRQLAAIRTRISDKAEDFHGIINNRKFKKLFTLSEEKLTRVPQGFSNEDPMAEFLKYKKFVVMRSLSDKEILSSDLAKTCGEIFKEMVPFNAFFNDAVITVKPKEDFFSARATRHF
jgi:uncharacterized protein (TIGR02453 family)